MKQSPIANDEIAKQISEKFTAAIAGHALEAQLSKAEIAQIASLYTSAFLEVAGKPAFKKDIETLALAHQ